MMCPLSYLKDFKSDRLSNIYITDGGTECMEQVFHDSPVIKENVWRQKNYSLVNNLVGI